MKKYNLFTCLLVLFSLMSVAQNTVKVKELKLKYTLPSNWTAKVFSSEFPWEKGTNEFCNCGAIYFFKQHTNGKMNIVVYPTTKGGLDSNKRNMVGNLRFEPVVKYDRAKNAFFQFDKKDSYFTDIKTKSKSFEVLRYIAKKDDLYFIIYAWQESKEVLNPNVEKELFEMVNGLEAF